MNGSNRLSWLSARCGIAGTALLLACGPQVRLPEATQPIAGEARRNMPEGAPRTADLRVSALQTKSDLPPIIPTLVPPGQTVVRPPIPVSLLAGEVSGLAVRQVQALALSGERTYETRIEGAGQRFAFENLDPWYYRLALVGLDRLLVIRKVVIVEPARPVFLHIEVEADGRSATLDRIPVPVEMKSLAASSR